MSLKEQLQVEQQQQRRLESQVQKVSGTKKHKVVSLEQERYVEERQRREFESQMQQFEMKQRSAAKMSFAELSAIKRRDLKVLHVQQSQ